MALKNIKRISVPLLPLGCKYFAVSAMSGLLTMMVEVVGEGMVAGAVLEMLLRSFCKKKFLILKMITMAFI